MLRLDVIGRVTTPSGAWEPARIMVDTHGRAAVWTPQGGRNTTTWAGTATAVESHAPPRTPRAAGPWAVTAADGTTLTVTKSGCGCGTPLGALGEMDLATATAAAYPAPAVQ